ncbi:MAG: hypothetical protein Q4G05_03060 [Clostridia bacterium]|nr:hypothetical protein [Clostridia bacterium]
MKNKIIFRKEYLLQLKKIIAFDKKTGKTIWISDKVYPQHFYPLSIKDYCNVVKKAVLNGFQDIPILSISVKDYPYCDFNCKDCLACLSREWAVNNSNIKYPIIPIDIYKNVLTEISNYSKNLGFTGVRYEICGEGNPDLYSKREEIIRFAVEKCDMNVVYVSTGSRISETLLDILVKYASCIRISFPGIGEDAYEFYSSQRNEKVFRYNDALVLLERLTARRKRYKKEDELMIGVRTCIRPLNEGHYKEFIKTIGALGVDSFQAVRVLTPDYSKHKTENISQKVIIELLELKEIHKQLGICSFQIPNNLEKIYNDRSLREEKKFSKCWSSHVSPILYGTNLISCALWDKIMDKNYHYGILEGNKNEVSKVFKSTKSKSIDKNCPLNCNECCAYSDNRTMDDLYKVLRAYDDVKNIDFYFEY